VTFFGRCAIMFTGAVPLPVELGRAGVSWLESFHVQVTGVAVVQL
jgi:hypothetical protein